MKTLLATAAAIGLLSTGAQAARIDGATVTLLPPPQCALPIPFPQDANGTVYANQTKSFYTPFGFWVTSPYQGIPALRNLGPFDALLGAKTGRSGAVYEYPAAQTTVTLLWGSQDRGNQIAFFNADRSVRVASFNGNQLMKALGLAMPTYGSLVEITPDAPWQRLELSANNVAFEWAGPVVGTGQLTCQ